MPEVPGLVVCRWCHALGPDAHEGLIQLPHELESAARDAGWHLESDEWICPECIRRRANASEN